MHWPVLLQVSIICDRAFLFFFEEVSTSWTSHLPLAKSLAFVTLKCGLCEVLLLWQAGLTMLVRWGPPVRWFADSALCGGCCSAGPGHRVAGCRILGDPGTSTGSLVGRVTVLKTLLPTLWQVKPDPGISAGLLAGRVLPRWLGSKEFPCNSVDTGSIPGLGRSPGGGNGYSLQYSCLANPMDRGAWWATVHGVPKSWTQLSN